MDKETVMTMVEEAVKDVLADQEVIEYIRELIGKRLLLVMEEEVLQRTMEGLVDKVVGDLRTVMANQVQSVMEEKTNAGLIGTGDTVINDKKIEDERKVVKEQTTNRKEKDGLVASKKDFNKQTVKNDNSEVNGCRKKHIVESAEVGKQLKKERSAENAALDRGEFNKDHQVENSTDGETKASSKCTDKKKTMEDLRKLMNMMEEMVQGAMDDAPDEDIMCSLKNFMHKEKFQGKGSPKKVNKVEENASSDSVISKLSQNRTTLKNKKPVEDVEEPESIAKKLVREETETIGKKLVREEPKVEVSKNDSEEDLIDGEVDIKEMLRLKKIISAMTRYAGSDVN